MKSIKIKIKEILAGIGNLFYTSYVFILCKISVLSKIPKVSSVNTLLSCVLMLNIIIVWQVITIKHLQVTNSQLKADYTSTLIQMDTTMATQLRDYRREVLANKQFFSELVYSSSHFGPCIESMLALHKGTVYFKSRFYEDSVLLKDAKELQADYDRALQDRAKVWRDKWGY